MPEISFGPYTLVSRLAVGGMAEVYLAQIDGRVVVVKQILPQLARDPELLQLFFDEAAIARQLSHPGIVQVFDVGNHEGTHFIAMEFVDGLDLDDLIRKQQRAGSAVPVPIAVRVVIDLARAVHFAHQAKDAEGRELEVIHRDISPQNVLLGRDGAVKLGDFGIARTKLRATRTQTGVLRGKIAYLAPERFLGERADRSVDVYAMGVVLFEAIAGKRPFVGDEALLIKKILHEPAPKLSTLAPGVDPRLEAIVDRALGKLPNERTRSAGELADSLEALGLAASRETLAAFVTKLADEKKPDTSRPAMPAAPPTLRPRTETLPGDLAEPTQVAATRPRAWDESLPSDIAETIELSPDTTAALAAPEVSAPAEPTEAAVRVVERVVPEPSRREPTTPERDLRSRPRPAPIVGAALVLVAFGAWILGRAPAAEPTRIPEIELTTTTFADAAPAPAPEPPLEELEPEPSEEPEARDAPRPKSQRLAKGKRALGKRLTRGEAEGEGELAIDADPWAYVSIGGKSLGITPLAHVRLPAGSHRVLLENPEARATRTITVQIRADQSTAVRVRLSDGKQLRP